MITVYGWRPGKDGAIEIKTTQFDNLETAMNWLRNCKMPCKDFATTPEENKLITYRLWNHN